MNDRALKVLEFNKIIEMLKGKASSALGKEAINEIKVYKDMDTVKRKLAETQEVVDIITRFGLIPFGAVHDLSKEMKIARVGSYLNIRQILYIADTLRTARQLKAYILKFDNGEDQFPIMTDYANSMHSFKYLEDKINRCILNEDEIADHASPELANIRSNIRRTNDQIRSKLDSIVSNPKTQKYLQDALVTVRNDRFVVPVKSSYKNHIKGIVHDKSSSGVTLYIEPNVVVDLNNKLKSYRMDEEAEIERILYELTGDIAEISKKILSNQIYLKKVDAIIAKANLSIEMKGIVPLINNTNYIRIVNGKHPLIPSEEAVPLNIWLGKEHHSLVITGPNTGGKTVTLKTIGLLTLMTMAGLHIPADYGTEISIFDEVFADIGDEQSIEQSLSTFSSHMTNIVSILKNVTPNSLVLFDELGAGTDPTEGAALATSILKQLHRQKILTVSTTHYNELKEYALVEEGIENACVEFDIETLSPTYKVLVGVPGKSNAFDISRKLGLSETVIDEAQKHIKKENVQFEEIISHIEKDRKVSEKEKNEAVNLRIEIEEMKKKLEDEQEKFASRKKDIVRKAKAEAKSILKDAKRESKEIISELRDFKDKASIDNKRVQVLKSTIDGKIKDQNEVLFDDESDHQVPDGLKEGDPVEIVTLGQEGKVLGINGDSITVQAGTIKINVDKSNLKRIKNIKKDNKPIKTPTKRINKSVKDISKELDIRGKNVDEATLIIDNYLDDVYLSSLEEVVIIHGKGTGALREGVREYLDNHYHVKNMRGGELNEGGSGVTVVTLN